MLRRPIAGVRVSEALAFVVATIGSISVLGYMYGAPDLLSIGSANQVSLPASIALVAAGVATRRRRPRTHLASELWRDSASPAGLRRLLPARSSSCRPGPGSTRR